MSIADLIEQLQTDDFDKLQEMHRSVEALYRLIEKTEGTPGGTTIPAYNGTPSGGRLLPLFAHAGAPNISFPLPMPR